MNIDEKLINQFINDNLGKITFSEFELLAILRTEKLSPKNKKLIFEMLYT
jgi:hypothetical protein